ncbi:F-box/FBD/LRR-repeat protein At1g13570-like [Rutidosis leptorrhynchoides]|uniref:F-box/FBD/LRR-repeat protein At1g13570-like n=1 Tax=Rutidosis leptorrhynchoides TaxID=125765 RepID=UPI003A99B9B9
MEEDEEDERKEMIRMMKKENAERKELLRKCKHFEDLHRKSKIINAIHQVMLMHHGAIAEFTLSMNLDNKCDEIDKIITYLSWKNTVKKLTLQMNVDLGDEIAPYKLPSSVFTFRLLTDLYLQQCSLYHLPRVGGFSCLTSLFLKDVGTNAAMVLRIVSKCPLLRSFGLVKFHWNVTFTLSFLCKLSGCLPVIEHLNIPIMPYWLSKSKFDLPKHPTPMVHLKYAHLHGSCFIGEYGWLFAVNFIRSSINLEKLKLQGYHNFKEKISEIDSFIPEENPDIRLEHLKELEFNVYRIIPELKFMKLILAISPVLKKVKITFQHIVNKHEEVDMLKDLSDAPRASEMAEIVVEHLLSDDES